MKQLPYSTLVPGEVALSVILYLTDTAMLISELTRFDSFYIFFHGTPCVFTMLADRQRVPIALTQGDFIWYQSSYNSNQSESNLRHLNFDPYPSRTRGGPWVTLVATHATMRMSLIFKCPIISIVSELSGFWGVSTIKWNSYPTLL